MKLLNEILEVTTTVICSLLVFLFLVITDLVVVPLTLLVIIIGVFIHHTCYEFFYMTIPSWWKATLETHNKFKENKETEDDNEEVI